ncbi:YgjV family protein [Vibrio gazogenes]|uniref:Inner membrane protein n=1 Tax=Vibrio gazogenes DSM 21264 = NBRC 103151 TaxID=1123492 RepID=A0A1M4TR13_VIBGA|nr:YgjV family protein [Vibrio gazogenes]USP16149.1 YgjV family protein [Vibrio gazogenes]SHE46950.1 inner membrane protein [Vibrio gazogenes DSM 21264] [Vibrio gazogenes DSM 21264 = NBRC 103151]SJN53006.1 Inner membrane protein YgjV [Vibrio gazogenes]
MGDTIFANDTLAQALGLVSFALGLSTFYQKNDRRLKILMLIFNLNHCIHYLLLGSTVSALSTMLSAARTTTAIFVSSIRVAAVFIVISLVSGVWMANHWWDLWSVVGTVIGTYSVFCLAGIKMRIGFLLGGICWLINNIIVGSIGGVMLETSLLSMNLLTIYRIHRQASNMLVKTPEC